MSAICFFKKEIVVKKLCIIMVMITINCLSAMDSILLHNQKQSDNSSWSSHEILSGYNPSSVKFSSSGKKIITLRECDSPVAGIKKTTVDILNGQATQKLFSYISDIKLTYVKLNKDETKLFMLNKDQMTCCDVVNNCVLWQSKAEQGELRFAQFHVCHDESKLLIQAWYKGILMDAANGKDIAVLWDHHDQENNNTITGGFYPQSSQLVVFHNGFLNNRLSNDIVQYKDYVPVDRHCPLYNSKTNELIYFGEGCCTVLNMFTKKEKHLAIYSRKGAMHCSVSLMDDGRKLFRKSYSGFLREDFKAGHCIVDFYDLETLSSIITIPCDFEPYVFSFNSKMGVLLLALENKLQLWNIFTHSLLCSLGFHDERIESASMNNEGDKIIVTHKDGQVILWQK